MSKLSELSNTIADHMLAYGPRTSGEIHQGNSNHSAISITAALRLLVDSKRAVRERINGKKGFLYKLAVKLGTPKKTGAPKTVVQFDDQKRTWQFQKTGKKLDDIKADPGPVVITKEDIKAVGWNINVPSAMDGFDEWWCKYGPFANQLWRSAPKSPELLQYMEMYQRQAEAAWVSAAQHFCPLSKIGEAWQTKPPQPE